MKKSSNVPRQPLPTSAPVPPRGHNTASNLSEVNHFDTTSKRTVSPDTRPHRAHVTRTAVVWVSTVIGLLLLVLLIVFIAQNQATVPLQYFGWNGSVGLGLTMFISAVAGGLVIAVVAVARIMQLRSTTAAQRKKLNHWDP